MKFKRGQLVELIKTRSGENLGHRFIVTDINESAWDNSDLDGEIGYKTDIPAKSNRYKYAFAPETWLKLVKPDSDELSEFSFTELMSNIKSSNEVKESNDE